MATVTIQVQNTAARRLLEKLKDAVGAGPILSVIGLRLSSYVDESFKTHGRGTWRPLAWSTLALRRRGGDQPLQDTGRYKQSFVKETDGKTFVEIGSNLKTPSGLLLAAIHEYGTGPYTIRVKQAKALAAQIGQGAHGAGEHGPIGVLSSGRSTNWLFFGKEVHHPGIPARPVLPNAATTERLVVGTVTEMLDTVKAEDGRR